nr:MAG TPA: hypothetical protein [Crassvirales sp.]
MIITVITNTFIIVFFSIYIFLFISISTKRKSDIRPTYPIPIIIAP